jgi:hypothetical protein
LNCIAERRKKKKVRKVRIGKDQRLRMKTFHSSSKHRSEHPINKHAPSHEANPSSPCWQLSVNRNCVLKTLCCARVQDQKILKDLTYVLTYVLTHVRRQIKSKEDDDVGFAHTHATNTPNQIKSIPRNIPGQSESEGPNLKPEPEPGLVRFFK